MLAGGASIQWSRRFASPDGTLVKISDVARHADVSPSTVSYVLSGKRTISEQTRRRVLDSIATRGYGHDVLLLTQDEGVAGLQRVTSASLVDAIILMDVEARDVRLPLLRGVRQPAVVIGFPADPVGLTYRPGLRG